MKALKIWAASAALALVFAVGARAQTYTLLHTYPVTSNNSSGIVAPGLMSQGRDGNFYSTISSGGAHTYGTAFKITPAGALTTLYDFCALAACADGSVPKGGLTLGTDGNLYGTTAVGGLSTFGGGTVFKITPTGTLTTMWKFTSTGKDGAAPGYAPFQGQDGNFYGVDPGVYTGDNGRVFKITPADKLTEPGIFNFTNGSGPNLPVQGADGNFYGTTQLGGTTCAHGCGVVYKMTPGGAITVLHDFTAYTADPTKVDGAVAYGALVQGNDGYLYGTTYAGGVFNLGTIFKISASGKSYTLLHSFENDATLATGYNPFTGLTMGSDGNFYGTARGGKHTAGVLFRLTPAGAYTVLYNFCSLKSCADGFNPITVLTQHTNGKFYGNTIGNSLGGSVFYSLNTGLKPFVSLVTELGKTGTTLEILGQGFTGATAVSFNGVAAVFNNVSDTYMSAVVPVGALSGPVNVTTFTGSMTSNRNFLVTPQIKSIPASGMVGASVVINGISLTQTSNVTIGGVSASFTVNSDSQLTATVPVGAKTGLKVMITTTGGIAGSPAIFAVVPSKIAFSPTSGKVGTAVTITGNSFTGATKVTFGGTVATSFQVIKDTQVDAIVPTGAVTGAVVVTTKGGTGTSTTSFTVLP